VVAARGSHILLEALANEGCDTIFGIPGVGTLAVYDAFCDMPAMRHIETRHEQGAVFMADGFARASGRPGVALSSGGPGALNTLTAMGTAYNDSVGVLHLVSENPRHLRRQTRGYFHDIHDQYAMFRPVSGFGIQVDLASEIPMAIHSAIHALLNRRPRPAIVEITSDALSENAEMELLPAARHQPTCPEPETVDRIAVLLAQAAAPLIWAGGGVAKADASAALLSLAERVGAPVLTSQKGKGAIPADHPLHIGNWAREAPVQALLDESDLLLAVGTRFSYFPTAAWAVRMPKRLVHVDIDPAVLGQTYPAEVQMVADARLALEALDKRVAALGSTQNPAWLSRAREAVRAVDRLVEGILEIAVLDEMRRVLPRDAMVFNDPTTIAFWARSAWKTYDPRSWFIPAGFGTLGYALPAAIGGKVGSPDRACVAIMGDAGSMFTIQDLMTAVQESIPVVLVVFNDRGYGVERTHQDNLYGRRSGVDITPPNFVALATSFGAAGELIADPLEIGPALERALERTGPTLIEVTAEFTHPGYSPLAQSA
jgi:thiamine pyrophosphate-dependent acetolactate synthase large subunit-like protein